MHVVQVWPPSLLNLGNCWRGWVVTFTPRPFYPWRNNTWRAAQTFSWRLGEEKHLLCLRVASAYFWSFPWLQLVLCPAHTAKQSLIPRLADNLLTSQTRITHYARCHGSGGRRRPLTAEAWVWAQSVLCGTFGGQSGTETGFCFRVHRLSSVTIIQPPLHIHKLAYHRRLMILAITCP